MTTNSFGRLSLLLAVLAYAVFLFAVPVPLDRNEPVASAIIPQPASVTVGEGRVRFNTRTPILTMAGTPGELETAAYLQNLLSETAGVDLAISDEGAAGRASIRLVLDQTLSLGPEAYRLVVDETGAEITAAHEAGLFYGAISLWQAMTPWPAGRSHVDVQHQVIVDEPEFGWRGVLLDSARHMQSVDYIKQFIDWMAVHKLNTLHWHITDDQAWRLEIRQYPRLTEVGAWRVPAGDAPAADIDPATGEPRLYGGYYTQDQVREIVAYAADRHITIMPEIDVPGHALAAVLAYPELGVVGAPPQDIMADWGVFPYLFNADESTFVFLENVLTEVIELFPSTYIHVGGDEAPKVQWEQSPEMQARMAELGVADAHALQGYFTQRLDDFLTSHGRRLVGWDEILEGGLSANATVMSWRGVDGAREAAEAGHDAILTPHPVLYLDHRQSTIADETPGRGHLSRLQDVYEFQPIGEAVSAEHRDHVLGVQANLWSEHIRTQARMSHMAWPRLAALSEVGWSPRETRDFDAFVQRLSPMMERYESLELTPADVGFRPVIEFVFNDGRAEVNAANQLGFGTFRFTLDGTDPSARSPELGSGLVVAEGTDIRVRSFDGGRPLSRVASSTANPLAHLVRRDDQLELCDDALVIYLEDDAPLLGERPNYNVNILDACWLWPEAPVGEAREIQIDVGNLPYNFQLMAAIDDVVIRPLADGQPELWVHEDGCDGEVVSRLSLAPALENFTVTTLHGVISSDQDAADLCFVFRTGEIEPLWVIDEVRLIPANGEEHHDRPNRI